VDKTYTSEKIVKNNGNLKRYLDLLTAGYDERYRDTDPVGLVHTFSSAHDRETAGCFVSLLAYGGAVQIRRSASRLLGLIGPAPAEFVRRRSFDEARKRLRGFKHRWTHGEDLAAVSRILGDVFERYGSVSNFVASLDNPDAPTVEQAMTGLSACMKRAYCELTGGEDDRRFSRLFPSPADGSACKRLALYFRWMVRGPDGIDFGIWNHIRPSRLVIPVDRHIARMGRKLGLTMRAAPDWKMALDITASLRLLDPVDPVRYDFALVRPGILGNCATADGNACRSCALFDLCTGPCT